MGVEHTFVSPIADGGDATLVQPSDWNDEHNLTEDLGNYEGNKYPSSFNAVSDEFDDGTLHTDWAWSGTAPSVYNETKYPGWFYVEVPTAANTGHLRRTYTPGATDFTVVTKTRVGFRDANTIVAGSSISLLTSADAIVWTLALVGASSGNRWAGAARYIDTVGTVTSTGFSAAVETYLMIQRTSGNVYTGFISFDGMAWQRTNSSTVATTVGRLAIGNNTNLASIYTVSYDFVRVFDSITFDIGGTP